MERKNGRKWEEGRAEVGKEEGSRKNGVTSMPLVLEETSNNDRDVINNGS